jgi:hypothetical protein
MQRQTLRVAMDDILDAMTISEDDPVSPAARRSNMGPATAHDRGGPGPRVTLVRPGQPAHLTLRVIPLGASGPCNRGAPRSCVIGSRRQEI